MFRMVRAIAFAAVAASFVYSAAAQQAGGATLLTAAVTATEAAKAQYAFDLELESSKTNWRARYEPTANPALRLVQPRREDLDGGQRRAFDNMAERMEGVSWCAGEGMARVADVRLVREDETTATYAFQPTRESIRSEQARQYADRMRGEVTLTKDNPDITRMRIYTPAAFAPVPLVRVDSFNMTIACQAAPNGRRFAAETVVDIRGSAFGQDFSERTVQRARNLQ